MKVRVAAIIILLLSTLYPFQVMSMELNIHGQKDFWTGVQLLVKEDPVTGEKLYKPNITFGQSLNLHFMGEDEMGYVRGYITDEPQLMEQIYLDMLLGDYSLQWDNYQQAFLVPSWFNLEQKFTGLRAGYLGQKDRISLIGLHGDQIMREDEIFLIPGDEDYGISLYFAPVVVDSVKVWLDNRELTAGEEYRVISYSMGIIELKIPIEKPAILRVKYQQKGEGYLVYGGRYDHSFSPALEGGATMMLARGTDVNQGLLGTEWIYQPKPWWVVELNAGLVVQSDPGGEILSEPLVVGDVVVDSNPPVNQTSHSLKELITSGEWDTVGTLFDTWRENLLTDLNWRMAQHISLGGLDLTLDYQVIENNLLNLLYNGRRGKSLTISGQYDGNNLLARHQQNYQWTLDDFLYQHDGELELVYFTEHWIPYLYYSQIEQAGMINQKGILELGYLGDLPAGWGSMTYQLGVDINTSPDQELLKGVEPYLGVRYDKNVDDSLGVKVYGSKGGKFAQLGIDGKWSGRAMNWKGKMNFYPEYFRIDQGLGWKQNLVDIRLDVTARQYYAKDEGYLNLDLNFDWSGEGAQEVFWISLLRDKDIDSVEQIYKLGFETGLEEGVVGFGEASWGDEERYYSGGVRGTVGMVDYDLNYTWSKTLEQLGNDFVLLQKDKVSFSMAKMDFWNTYGEIELDQYGQWWSSMGVKYPITPRLELGIQYSLDKLVDYTHQMTLRTAYYF